jgi:hypothetical protein
MWLMLLENLQRMGSCMEVPWRLIVKEKLGEACRSCGVGDLTDDAKDQRHSLNKIFHLQAPQGFFAYYMTSTVA